MAVRVKIAKDKLVAALNEKLASNEENKKTLEVEELAYQKTLEQFKKTLDKFIKDNGFELNNISHYSWRGVVEVSYKVPQGVDVPQTPEKKISVTVLSQHEINEIKNAIRILELSDEEFVNTSTYKDVARYL